MKEHQPLIRWSVWDGSPTVQWVWQGQTISKTFNEAPISVAILGSASLVAIAAMPSAESTGNLLTYQFNGQFFRAFSCSKLGADAKFLGIAELRPQVFEVAVECMLAEVRVERAASFDLNTGEIGALHPTR